MKKIIIHIPSISMNVNKKAGMFCYDIPVLIITSRSIVLDLKAKSRSSMFLQRMKAKADQAGLYSTNKKSSPRRWR